MLPNHDPSLSPASSSDPSGLTPKRVLIIDDDPVSTQLSRLTLQRISTFSTFELNRPALAIATARHFKPDLVLLDVEMPGMDGGNVWCQFRADPEFKSLPIIFLTSLITDAEANDRRYDGNTHVIAKPLTLAKLAAAIAGRLGHLCAPARPSQ